MDSIEGVGQITDRLPIMDLHVLKTADGQVYEFFLPLPTPKVGT